MPEQQAYLQIIRTANVLGQSLSQLLAEHGLSGKQYNALRAIRRAGTQGATPSEIAAQLTDPRADVTRLADRLVREGYVHRAPDKEDRRVVRLTLTDDGATRLGALDEPLLELHRAQLSHMSAGELATLSKLLKKARRE
ncbi:MAG: MarR family transcriptional regulator [Planctomycetota bacterium]